MGVNGSHSTKVLIFDDGCVWDYSMGVMGVNMGVNGSQWVIHRVKLKKIIWHHIMRKRMKCTNQNVKVEAVVKSLIKIRNEDGEAKSLVFSTWTGGRFLFTYTKLYAFIFITLFFRCVGYFGGSLG